MKPPMAYYGAKTSIADQIVQLLPPHLHYVEPYAGSLAVLLAKPRSVVETVNDINSDLMTFWQVLRDAPDDLARVCSLTPHSRAEREIALNRDEGLTNLERARRVWVCLTQGRTGTLRRTGWRQDMTESMPRRLTSYTQRLAQSAARLADVTLECRPALQIIDTYGRCPDVLLYVDPPYLGSTRHRNYRNEMTDPAAHRELSKALHACTATALLSGYPSDLYDHDLYADWHRHEIQTTSTQGSAKRARAEVIWSNRPIHAQLTLTSSLTPERTSP